MGTDGEQPPKVSVCVITYNHARCLATCLQSILDQKTDFPFEVIVGDDCSSDGTQDILRDFATRYPEVIRPIYQPVNTGGTDNWLDVHAAAIGEYVAHCDGDDCWLPGKLAHQVSLLDRQPNASQSWTFANLIDDSGKKTGRFPGLISRLLNPTKLDASDIALSYALVGQHSTQMYRRSFAPKLDRGSAILDYWLAFNLSLKGHCIYSKRTFSNYRVTSTHSITRTRGAKRTTVDVLSKHLSDIVQHHPKFAAEAKANLIVRRFFSKLRGHDTTTIDQSLQRAANVPTSPAKVVRSAIYFAAQKLSAK